MRKETTTVITRDGRDKGKTFTLTEMPAIQGDRWARRCLMAMVESGVDIPEEIRSMGMAGVAAMGFKALLTIKFEVAEILMAELLEGVRFVPDPKKAEVIRPLIEDDVEEIMTYSTLRMEMFELCTGFSIAGFLSRLTSLLPANITSTTPTSDPLQEQSSQADSPPSKS